MRIPFHAYLCASLSALALIALSVLGSAAVSAQDSATDAGERFPESRTLILSVRLAPGDAFALRRCPRGYAATDLDARPVHWPTTRRSIPQERTRYGYVWRFPDSDSRSAVVRWYRPTKRYPWRPGVARNASAPTGSAVRFDRYCQKGD